jgi:RimJ/RimL family protein N-acetyltransferase
MNGSERHGEEAPVMLSDGVVLLRPWMSSDASFMAKAATDPEVQCYNTPAPTSVADALSNIDRIDERWRSFEVDGDATGVAFAVVDVASDEPVGMCGVDLWSGTDVAQFGYWLAAGARGRGFATRSVRLMTSWLFQRGAARVFVTIESESTASAAVVRRAGFIHEGTLRSYGLWQGRRRDVDVFAMLPDEWPVVNDR